MRRYIVDFCISIRIRSVPLVKRKALKYVFIFGFDPVLGVVNASLSLASQCVAYFRPSNLLVLVLVVAMSTLTTLVQSADYQIHHLHHPVQRENTNRIVHQASSSVLESS